MLANSYLIWKQGRNSPGVVWWLMNFHSFTSSILSQFLQHPVSIQEFTNWIIVPGDWCFIVKHCWPPSFQPLALDIIYLILPINRQRILFPIFEVLRNLNFHTRFEILRHRLWNRLNFTIIINQITRNNVSILCILQRRVLVSLANCEFKSTQCRCSIIGTFFSS